MLVVGLAVALVVLPQAAVGEHDCPAETSEAAREEARLLMAASEKYLTDGDWDRGEQALHDAVRLDPASPLLQYTLGAAMMDRQRFPEAILAFTRSREAFRCLREAGGETRQRFRDRLDREIQQLRTTIANIERERLQRTVIKWQEMNGDPNMPLGQSAQLVHGLERRLGELQRLRQKPEQEPTALAMALGNAHFRDGGLKEAEREFRSALATEPTNGDAHNNLSVVLMLLDRLDEAEREIKAAEKCGVKVAPRLKDEIRKRRAAARP